ncbi:hypothetical protein WMY93_011509 [Mugilogobius chulae]|uniref:Uncharacterized protein n=1 Tax=Mugilogobius chulae TaxID=88201 RepID=A0AAW0P2S1_9GOBI
MLKKQVPVIVKALHKQLKDKSVKSRQGCFSSSLNWLTLSQERWRNTSLLSYLRKDPRHVQQFYLLPYSFSLTDKSTSSTMRIDALSFFNVLLSSNHPQAFQPHMQVLLPPVVACVEDSFYKITSEALLVTQQLVKVMRPLDQTTAGGAFDPKPFVKGATTWAELQGIFNIFLERLKNEITRLTTVRTITLITTSPPTSAEAGDFSLFNSFSPHQASSIKPAALEPVLSELPPLVDESDMHVSQVPALTFTDKGLSISGGEEGTPQLPPSREIITGEEGSGSAPRSTATDDLTLGHLQPPWQMSFLPPLWNDRGLLLIYEKISRGNLANGMTSGLTTQQDQGSITLSIDSRATSTYLPQGHPW